ncbi:TetR/AcrR family transcriptional regulator [Arenibaculum sp.]|jgi:AcrR family transcriptional regulator|uniref:TetR/AcrR family transcriptional regulator n=1 Tax=Arenibaculum sp. TaxID=2865862 RepID=UPI002E150333|nr:TetR/AcrR family transcriptional regulator [Arenibaculum sp.]
MKRTRGRPRAYDPGQALDRATELFRRNGFSATSLDGLAEATGMNRPSLYAGFGDKRALYLKALDRFRARADRVFGEAVADRRSVAEAVEGFFAAALDLYAPEGGEALGCLALCTATAEAASDEAIQDALRGVLAEIDGRLEALLLAAKERGELPADGDAEGLSLLLAATLHSIAIRARAGQPRRELEASVAAALGALRGALSRSAA